MATATRGTTPPPAVSTHTGEARYPLGVVTRDIARGGLAGMLVGIVVGGIGGRLFMRAAALLHPEAVGLFTQNGNRVGDITLEGTLALVIFIGLFAGLAVGVVWVTVQPWIPGSGWAKALLTMPVAVALGSFGLLEGPNPDFRSLGFDPAIVGLIVAFFALVGLSVALVDAWLDRRLPPATTAASSPFGAYVALTTIGVALGAVVVVPFYLQPERSPVGLSLLVTGVATIAWWIERVKGRSRPATWVRLAGRGGLLAAVIFGFVGVATDAAVAIGA